MKRKPTKHGPHKSANQVSIIGGQWRGRKLLFADIEGLRPTGSRIRETLFNWLAPYLAGANCLDLFCGSGALGVEALSRGAQSTTFVDNEPKVIQQLGMYLKILEATNAQLICQDSNQWLETFQIKNATQKSYNIIFLDPPFASRLLADSLTYINRQGVLDLPAWVYIEMAVQGALPPLPMNWRLHRQQSTGNVQYFLYLVS